MERKRQKEREQTEEGIEDIAEYDLSPNLQSTSEREPLPFTLRRIIEDREFSYNRLRLTPLTHQKLLDENELNSPLFVFRWSLTHLKNNFASFDLLLIYNNSINLV